MSRSIQSISLRAVLAHCIINLNTKWESRVAHPFPIKLPRTHMNLAMETLANNP